MTSHPYTPSPSELPGLLSGEVTEVWVEMEKQPDTVLKGVPLVERELPSGRKYFQSPRSPYAVGDVLVVESKHKVDDIETLVIQKNLTITAVTPQQRDGVWGFAYEVATTKGNDDE